MFTKVQGELWEMDLFMHKATVNGLALVIKGSVFILPLIIKAKQVVDVAGFFQINRLYLLNTIYKRH